MIFKVASHSNRNNTHEPKKGHCKIIIVRILRTLLNVKCSTVGKENLSIILGFGESHGGLVRKKELECVALVWL